MSLKLTIEKAVEVVGSQAELARMLDVAPQHISNYKTGKKICGLERRIQIAKIAGEDPRRAIVDYLADQLDESDDYKAEVKQQVIAIYESFDPKTKKPLQAESSQGVSWRKRRDSNPR
ncbi:hypothetical protein RD110_10265 [Rhodoferax koreense]|uniref:HTH cro/C1-type domain-containing protein n=1 Tax=Rhodoferax koreensis TaxID=1842727 RepID=A0A1P8JUU7_9BURK|nr:YdaS family helix-turn-helix protein [Rhodoferax koreense]APW37524.1 hypothetical protein RD110_10265 [Rhodoferax koreense]